MHIRLTAVLLAGLIAIAGSGLSAPSAPTEPPSSPYALPAIDRFDDLRPTVPPSAATTQRERVTLTTRPIVRPASRSEHAVTRADLDRTGVLVAAYRSAAAAAPESCNLPVALLAAIGQIESGSAGGRQIGRDHVVQPGIFGPLLDGGPFAVIRDTDGGAFDGDRQWDRAVGPLQFIPSTWAWAGVDGDGDGRADPQNVYDAAYSAAGYLCRYGRDLSHPGDLRAAIWSYNQSTDYVIAVLEWLAYFQGKGLEAVGSVGFEVSSGGRASELPPVESGTATAFEPGSDTAATTSPTTSATTTPEPVTTTGSGTATATPTTSAPTTTTATTGTPTTSTTGTPGTSTTGTPTTSTTGTPTTHTATACPSPTATVTVTPTPTTTTTAAPTTTTPTTTPTTCPSTVTVTPTATAGPATTTTAATEGSGTSTP